MLVTCITFRGAPCHISQLFTRAFQHDGTFNFSTNIVSSKTCEPGGLSKCTVSDKESFFKEGHFKYAFSWETKTFSKQLTKKNYRPGNPRLCREL